MPDTHENEPGRRRARSLDGLRDLERRTNPSARERRRAERDAGMPPGRSGRHAIGAGAGRNTESRGGAGRSPTSSGGSGAGAGAGHGTTGRGGSGPRTATGLGALRVGGLRRRWPRRMLIGVNVVVAICLVAGVSAYGYVEHQLGNVTKVSVRGLTAAESGPFTVLIVGSDTRDLSGPGNSQFGSAAGTPGQRSDTIMLARVVPKTRSLTLLSIPRDLWVDIAGLGQSRINSAFNNGPDLLVSTIQRDLGIQVNHFVEINFDTFESITDAVGGVKVWFPTPAKDAYSLLEVPTAGCVNLTGAQALGFARSRHYQYYQGGEWQTQGLSDLARIQRQQFYVKKMIAKAESKLSSPLALNRVLTSITKNLTVDSRFSTHLMVSLAEDFHSADVAGIPTETLPTFNEVIGNADVLGLQQPQAQAMIQSFDSLGTTSSSSHSTTATTAPHSHLPVEVANGSGVNNQAAQAARDLGRLGYKATVDDQSPGYDFTQSDIEYAPDAKTAAEQLQAQIGGGATLTRSAALASTAYDLELVTGSNYTGVAGQHATSKKATKTATKEPTGKTSKATPTTATGSERVADYPLPGPSPTEAQLASC